jgi:hypothetical protein
LPNRRIQTGQTGGQLYSDAFPFSIPRYYSLPLPGIGGGGPIVWAESSSDPVELEPKLKNFFFFAADKLECLSVTIFFKLA